MTKVNVYEWNPLIIRKLSYNMIEDNTLLARPILKTK
jgi:hypothetical protein